MKKLLLLAAILCAMGAQAAQYCSSQITGTRLSHKAYVTCQSLGDTLYEFVFVSVDPFTGYNAGSNFYANVNGVGGYHLPSKFAQSGDTLSCQIVSSQAPTIYVGDFFVNYSDGEEWFKIPTDADFSQSCAGIAPDTTQGGGGSEPEPVLTPGTCGGISTAVDETYSAANDKAVTILNQGYKWTAETTSKGVDITVKFLDQMEGMAAPQLFRFDETNTQIGIVNMNWDGGTQTASTTLTGVQDGDQIIFLVRVALPAGAILFTSRVMYTVGSDCGAIVDENVLAYCEQTLNGVDPEYSANDAQAAQAANLTNGYRMTCTTYKDMTVGIETKFLDSFTGLAAPFLYVFTTGSDGAEVLSGDPIAMQMSGVTASYSLIGYNSGQPIIFLVKVAYAGHTLYTSRVRYVVAAGCDGVVVNPDEPEPDPEPEPEPDVAVENVNGMVISAVKTLEDGHLVITVDGVRYNALGAKL